MSYSRGPEGRERVEYWSEKQEEPLSARASRPRMGEERILSPEEMTEILVRWALGRKGPGMSP